MISFRVSTVEAFRLACTTDYKHINEVVDAIRRGQEDGGPTTRNMEVGTAWHSALALEEPDHAVTSEDGILYVYGSYSFREVDIKRATQHTGPGIHEVPGGRVFDIRGTPVEIRGRCDHINGATIRDGKTKLAQVDCSPYEKSLQWRLYLLIFGAESFYYDLFSFREKEGVFSLRDIISVRHWRYQGMEEECKHWISRLLDWAHERKLMPFLEGNLARHDADV